MGNEHHAEAEVLAQPLDLVQDLPLDHDVQRGRRLVHDDDLGVQRQGHRDDDPLAHPAGQFVGETAQPPRVDADHLEQFRRPGVPGPGIYVRAVRPEDVAELLAQARHRVQRVHRALEDHRDLVPAELAELLALQRHQVDSGSVPAEELDGTAGELGGGPQHPGERVGERGFAAPALPRDAEHLAPAQLERDVAHRPGRAPARVLDADVLGPQDHIAGHDAVPAKPAGPAGAAGTPRAGRRGR